MTTEQWNNKLAKMAAEQVEFITVAFLKQAMKLAGEKAATHKLQNKTTTKNLKHNIIMSYHFKKIHILKPFSFGNIHTCRFSFVAHY